MLSRITAKIVESWQPKESALDRAKTHLEQAKKQKEEGSNDDALWSLIQAKAALKTHLKGGVQIAETRRLLAELHWVRAEILPLTKDFTLDQVRQSYLKAQAYSPNTAQQENIRACLDGLARPQNSTIIQRRPTLSPSDVLPAPVLATGLPISFFTPSSLLSPVTLDYQLVWPDEIKNTRHLAWCLQQTHCDTAQRKQLLALAREVIERFGQRAGKDLVCLQEAAELAVVPSLEIYRQLIAHTVVELNPARHPTLDMGVVQGLAVIVRNCPEALLKKEGGVRGNTWTSILSVLITRLNTVYKGQSELVKELIEAISQLLDAMVQAGVSGISRLKLQKPLADLLRDSSTLNPHQDQELAWHIRYTREALAYIPNDESRAQAVLRCLFSASMGILSLASAIKSCDIDKLLESFNHFEETFICAQEAAKTVDAAGGSKKAAKLANRFSAPGGLKEAVKNVEQMLASFGELQTSYEDRTRQKGWYTALQCLDMLIETKEWEKFEQFIRQSAYRQNAHFLQGVCQRLERIVCVEDDQTIQAQAIQFLKSLETNAKQWLSREGGKLSPSPSDIDHVQQMAQVSLARLKKRADTILGLDDIDFSLDWYALSKDNLSTQLLQTARRKLDKSLVQKLFNTLAQHIEKLRTDYLEGLAQDKEIKDALANYVPPEGMSLYDDTRFDIAEKIQAFLDSDKKSLLLLGEAGAGKSTLNRHFARQLWQAYMHANKHEEQAIPIFIALSSLLNTSPNLVNTFFKQQGFSEEQIHTLQTQHRFVLILDGFDEIEGRHRDFYKDNQLAAWKHAKIIISSRPEYLGSDYQYKFHPTGEPTALQEYRLAPFSPATVARYVEQYSKNHPTAPWRAENYKKALQEPNLQALVSNPFLLKMAVSELPNLSAADLQGSSLTRLSLYAQFVKSWFARSRQRLAHIQLDAEETKEFKRVDGEGFDAQQMDFSQALAIQMYKAGEVVSSYTKTISSLRGRSRARDEQDWRARLLGNDNTETKLKRLNAPLIVQDKANGGGKTYRFIHKSVRDYFVAQTLWEEFDAQSELEPTSWFNTFNLVDDPAILDFLSERVHQASAFKAQLLNVIERTKTETKFARGAANAITVLVGAGVSFLGTDLSGIQIPGANLSYGVFDSVQWLGADLRQVNLTGAWLRNADLSGARMEGVQFGELPGLRLENEVHACCYSSDDRLLIVAHGNTVTLYDTHTLEEKGHLIGDKMQVTSVVISADGRYVVSGGDDHMVRVWDWQTPEALPCILRGHQSSVNSVVMSADGRYVVSGSWDNTVRVWDWQTPEAAPSVLSGHENKVNSVAMSADGRYVVSGGDDNMVRVLDLQTPEAAPRILRGHKSSVNSVVMSADGRYVVSGSWDNTVRVWDLQTPGAVPTILSGHRRCVTSVVTSADGRYVVSGSDDSTVRVWDWQMPETAPRIPRGHKSSVKSVVMSANGRYVVSEERDDNTVLAWDWQTPEAAPSVLISGYNDRVNGVVISADGRYVVSGSGRVWDLQTPEAAPRILDGHTDSARSVVMSADGRYVVSGSGDNMVRVWDWQTREATPLLLRGHKDGVTSVVISDDSRYVVSGSWDKTVRVWDLQTPEAAPRVLKGHEGMVNSVVMSADGRYVVSGSVDSTVRVWDWQTPEAAPRILRGHTSSLHSVVMSADGRYVVFVSGISTVRVWDLHTPEAASRVLKRHEGMVNSVVMSANGPYVAFAGDDSTVRVWDITLDQCLATFHGFNGAVNSVAWQSVDGLDYLITGSDDKMVRCWQLLRADDQWQVRLRWASGQDILTLVGAKIEGVEGLSPMNCRLLEQRGATGEPRETIEQQSQPSLTERAEAPMAMRLAQANSRSSSGHLNFA